MDKVKLINFRDMGGLETPDGVIRRGKIYRTAIFTPKTKADRAYIRDMHLDEVVDFRTVAESTEKPDHLPEGVVHVNASIFGESDSNGIAPTAAAIRSFLRMNEAQLDEVRAFVARQYTEMPFSAGYAELFRLMDEGKTFAFHCTAGKDRTGIGAMLIELALGRDWEQCREQYLLSNDYRAAETERICRLVRLVTRKPYTHRFARDMITVHDYLFDSARDAILAAYPDVDAFLSEVHGITKTRRRHWIDLYVEGK
jgi:protein-tyrosine phosphatase